MKKTLIILPILILLSVQVCAYSKSILVIGDSQTHGNFGASLYEHLKSKSHKLKMYGVGGSSPRHWADIYGSDNSNWLCDRWGRVNKNSNTPMRSVLCKKNSYHSIFAYANRAHRELVIFQFLGNSMGWSEQHIKSKVDSLINELTNQKCIFITSPPYHISLSQRNELRKQTEDFFIKAVDKRCEVIKGMTQRNLSTFATDIRNYNSDKIHMSSKGAKVFLNSIKSQLP